MATLNDVASHSKGLSQDVQDAESKGYLFSRVCKPVQHAWCTKNAFTCTVSYKGLMRPRMTGGSAKGAGAAGMQPAAAAAAASAQHDQVMLPCPYMTAANLLPYKMLRSLHAQATLSSS